VTGMSGSRKIAIPRFDPGGKGFGVESPEAVEKLEISENQDNSWPLLPRDQPTDQVEVLWTRPVKFTTHLCFEVGGGRGAWLPQTKKIIGEQVRHCWSAVSEKKRLRNP
jgi:hypothetical protein